MDFAQLIIVVQAITTWITLGLITFVQIVHYPLFAKVGDAEFEDYERIHVFRTTLVFGGPMLVELITAILCLLWLPEGIETWIVYLAFFLLVVVWVSSFAIQVPQHHKLKNGFARRPWEILVKTNWIRVVAWGGRAILLAWCLLQLIA